MTDGRSHTHCGNRTPRKPGVGPRERVYDVFERTIFDSYLPSTAEARR